MLTFRLFCQFCSLISKICIGLLLALCNFKFAFCDFAFGRLQLGKIVGNLFCQCIQIRFPLIKFRNSFLNNFPENFFLFLSKSSLRLCLKSDEFLALLFNFNFFLGDLCAGLFHFLRVCFALFFKRRLISIKTFAFMLQVFRVSFEIALAILEIKVLSFQFLSELLKFFF